MDQSSGTRVEPSQALGIAALAASQRGSASTGRVVASLAKNRHAACVAASEDDNAGSACNPAATR